MRFMPVQYLGTLETRRAQERNHVHGKVCVQPGCEAKATVFLEIDVCQFLVVYVVVSALRPLSPSWQPDYFGTRTGM